MENINSNVFDRELIVEELYLLISILDSNLFFNKISLKNVTCSDEINNRSFLTPKLRYALTNCGFKTCIVQELVSVLYIIILKLYEGFVNEFNILGNFLMKIISIVLINFFSSEFFFDKLLIYPALNNCEKNISQTITESSSYTASSQENHNFQDLKLQTAFQTLIKCEMPVNKIINISNMINEFDEFPYYNGFILKLPVSNSTRISLLACPNGRFFIKNICLYKSDETFDIKILRRLTQCEECEDNEVIIQFIERWMILNNINTLFLIGCGIDKEIELIFQNYSIICYDWLSWKNYQDLISFFLSTEHCYSLKDFKVGDEIFSFLFSPGNSVSLYIDRELTLLNNRYIFFQSNGSSMRLSYQYLIIQSYNLEYGKAIKHNLRIHLRRLLSVAGVNRIIWFSQKLLNEIISTLQHVSSSSTAQTLFPFLHALSSLQIDVEFAYTKRKLLKLFSEAICQVKFLLRKYYY